MPTECTQSPKAEGSEVEWLPVHTLVQTAWVGVLALQLRSSVTLGKLCSVTEFSDLWMG